MTNHVYVKHDFQNEKNVFNNETPISFIKNRKKISSHNYWWENNIARSL